MTSFDDELRGLFEQSGPDPSQLRGDLATVRRTVRRRKTTRRAVATLSVLAIGGVAGLWSRPDPDDGQVTLDGDDTTVPSTSAPTSTSTTTSSTTSTTTFDLPGPMIRAVDFGEATFAPPCPGDDRSVNLSDGRAHLPLDGAFHDVWLGPVGYGDVDADGREDAVAFLYCAFAGASTETYGNMQAYRQDESGALEQLGTSQPLDAVHHVSAEPAKLTVDRDVYAAGDARCCPSAGARETWIFNGEEFVLLKSVAIPPPGAGN